jgi:hypothetical protein
VTRSPYLGGGREIDRARRALCLERLNASDGKTRSPRSFGARPTQPKPTSELGAMVPGDALPDGVLGPHIDEQVLDFYHASQYLAGAAAAICKHEQEREQWLDEQCHNLKHKHHAAQRILRELEQAPTTKMKPDQKKDLQDCITYFGNHLHQMRYARYVENAIPIGSGVTEAACKTLVKQRLCSSGMRWTPEGARIILSLRALALTETRWEQFWQKINQYGVPEISIH